MARLICSWCGAIQDDDYPTEEDSHGICPDCYDKVMAELDEQDETDEEEAL